MASLEVPVARPIPQRRLPNGKSVIGIYKLTFPSAGFCGWKDELSEAHPIMLWFPVGEQGVGLETCQPSYA